MDISGNIAGVSTSMLRVEVEAAMLSGMPPVMSLLLGARDLLGQELMPAALGTPKFLLRPAIRAPRNWISADMAPAVIARLQRALVTDDVPGDYRFDAPNFDASGVFEF